MFMHNSLKEFRADGVLFCNWKFFGTYLGILNFAYFKRLGHAQS